MKFKGLTASILVCFTMIACSTTNEVIADDPLTAAISGKTLVQGDNRILFSPNGRLSGTLANGDEVAGAWAIRDGRYCRTLTSPERVAGTVCQDVELGEQTVSFDGNVWAIE